MFVDEMEFRRIIVHSNHLLQIPFICSAIFNVAASNIPSAYYAFKNNLHVIPVLQFTFSFFFHISQTCLAVLRSVASSMFIIDVLKSSVTSRQPSETDVCRYRVFFLFILFLFFTFLISRRCDDRPVRFDH